MAAQSLPAKCQNPECGKSIPEYRNMGGRGFESAAIEELQKDAKGEVVRGADGKQVIVIRHLELCKECKKAEHKKLHPDAPELVLPGIVQPDS